MQPLTRPANEPRRDELGKLALNRARSGACLARDLAEVERTLGTAEQQGEDSALRLTEKRLGDRISRDRSRIGHDRTHSGHACNQNGYDLRRLMSTLPSARCHCRLLCWVATRADIR